MAAILSQRIFSGNVPGGLVTGCIYRMWERSMVGYVLENLWVDVLYRLRFG
jgi:hypothetical protein